MNTVEFNIPFPGFYCSCLAESVENEVEMSADWAVERHADDAREDGLPELDADDVRDAYWSAVDIRAAHGQVAEEYMHAFLSVIADYAESAGNYPDARAILGTVDYSNLDSPREYNFRTDRLFVSMPADTFERMYSDVDSEVLDALIRETFKPRSGFDPYYSDDPEVWRLKPPTEYDNVERAVVFEAYCRTLCALGSEFERAVEESTVNALHDDNAFGTAVADQFSLAKFNAQIRDLYSDESNLGE
jgi:hypothetical protein